MLEVLILLPFLCCSNLAAQELAQEPQESGVDSAQEPETPQEEHLRALEELLAIGQLEDREWRVSIWEHLTQLELAPAERVLPGWQALAASELPGDLANLVLYQRRHQLPLLAADLENEPADVLLERSLAAWGAREFQETQELLQIGLTRFPTDERFISNFAWLNFQAPATLQARGDARHWALSVLAARRAQS